MRWCFQVSVAIGVATAVASAAIVLAADRVSSPEMPASSSPATRAASPTYQTIAPIGARPKRGYLRYPGQVQPMPAEPYSWGWFGAQPRSNGAYQRGYHGELWSWGRSGG